MTRLTYGETTLREGGLMRCCLATIAEHVDARADEEAPRHLIMDCKCEASGNQRICLIDGRWEWNRA